MRQFVSYVKRKIQKMAVASVALAFPVSVFIASSGIAVAASPWNLNGIYNIAFTCAPVTPTCGSGTFVHDAVISGQNSSGNFNVSGGYPAGGPYTYAWNGTGNVSGNAVSMNVTYTSGADTSNTDMTMTGTISPTGVMSGTWNDDFPNGAGTRSGTWTTSAGFANKAGSHPFTLVPGEFVGTAEQCGTAGTDTVTAMWDSSMGNPKPSVMLQKLGATSNCAAAYLDIITPLEGQPVSNLLELNYDYKTGEHCGAGAPRFNIQTENGTVITLGCTSGTQTSAGPGWTHVEFNAAQIQAALLTVAGNTPATILEDLYLIFDEGSDTPPGGTVGTPGTVHIDNISVNNDVVGSPTAPQNKEQCKHDGWKNYTDNNGQPFRNQGQCVSYFNHNRTTNHNNVRINNNNNQNARSGNASVRNNTTGGNATSGGASNSNNTTNNVNISNNPTF